MLGPHSGVFSARVQCQTTSRYAWKCVEAVCCERLPHKIPGHLLMGESPPSGSDGSLSQAHMFLTKSSMIAPSPQGTSNASSFFDPSTPCCAKSEHTVTTSSVCEQRGHHERQCPPFPSVTSSCCTAVRAPVSSCSNNSSGRIECASPIYGGSKHLFPAIL